MYVLCCYPGTLLRLCYFYVICVFCRLVVLVRLSVPVQVIDWRVSSQKLPISVDGDVKPHSLTHLLTHCTCIRVGLRLLHCALSIVAQCIVIGPVCGGRMGGRRAVFVAGGVRYHDNSKLRASIFTKLGLYVQVVTISS